MRQEKLNLNDKISLKKTANTASKILKNGGVIIYPTDTLYGIGANATDEKAIRKVYKIKKQRSDKPISIIVNNIKTARRVACIDFKTEEMLNKIWPGPITVILRKKDVIPYILTANTETVAVRIPNNEFISELTKTVNFPITATSANISGERDLLNSEEIQEKFGKDKEGPDLFIDAGEIKNPKASAIIDLTGNMPKIIRTGIIEKEKIEEFLKNFFIQ